MRYLVVRGSRAISEAARSWFDRDTRSATLEYTVESPSGARLTVLLETPLPENYAPRIPIDDDAHRLIWTDGFPLHESFDAFDVRELARRTHEWPDLLGRFAILRLDKRTGEIEIRTDPLGSCPVYLATMEGTDWAVSNVPALAHTLARPGEIDHFGASGALCACGPIHNHTLITTVRLLGPSSRTTASPDAPPITTRRDRLIEAGVRTPDLETDDAAEMFRHRIAPVFARLAEAGFDLRCGLTGGRDSRAVAALLASAVDEPRYHFGGGVDAPESRIAARVAEALGGSFTLKSDPNNPITDNYDAAERHMLLRDCGMVDFSFLRPPPADTTQGDRREIHLTGQAGEFGRWPFESLTGLLATPSVTASRRRLAGRIAHNGGGLFTEDAHRRARDHITDLVADARAAGVTRVNLQTVVVNQLKAYRWAAMQVTRVAERREMFAPFLSELFFTLSVRISPRDRFADGFQRAIIRRCAPEALAVPFHGYSGTAQRLRNEIVRNALLSSPTLARVYGRRKPPGRHARWEPWLRPILKERLLAHGPTAEVWRFVDRSQAERALCDESGKLFRASIYPLLAATTVIRFWDLYAGELRGAFRPARTVEPKPAAGSTATLPAVPVPV